MLGITDVCDLSEMLTTVVDENCKEQKIPFKDLTDEQKEIASDKITDTLNKYYAN